MPRTKVTTAVATTKPNRPTSSGSKGQQRTKTGNGITGEQEPQVVKPEVPVEARPQTSGGVASKAAIRKIREELKCPVCLDLLDDPRLLPCHHTFCLNCLKGIQSQTGHLLKCPVCSKEYFIRGRVSELPRDFRVNSLLDCLPSLPNDSSLNTNSDNTNNTSSTGSNNNASDINAHNTDSTRRTNNPNTNTESSDNNQHSNTETNINPSNINTGNINTGNISRGGSNRESNQNTNSTIRRNANNNRNGQNTRTTASNNSSASRNSRTDVASMPPPPSPAETFWQRVTCPICSQIYEEPRQLDCSHSFCTGCLEFMRPMTEPVIHCPTCQAPTDIPDGVRALPINMAKAQYIEAISEQGLGDLDRSVQNHRNSTASSNWSVDMQNQQNNPFSSDSTAEFQTNSQDSVDSDRLRRTRRLRLRFFDGQRQQQHLPRRNQGQSRLAEVSGRSTNGGQREASIDSNGENQSRARQRSPNQSVSSRQSSSQSHNSRRCNNNSQSGQRTQRCGYRCGQRAIGQSAARTEQSPRCSQPPQSSAASTSRRGTSSRQSSQASAGILPHLHCGFRSLVQQHQNDDDEEEEETLRPISAVSSITSVFDQLNASIHPGHNPMISRRIQEARDILMDQGLGEPVTPRRRADRRDINSQSAPVSYPDSEVDEDDLDNRFYRSDTPEVNSGQRHRQYRSEDPEGPSAMVMPLHRLSMESPLPSRTTFQMPSLGLNHLSGETNHHHSSPLVNWLLSANTTPRHSYHTSREQSPTTSLSNHSPTPVPSEYQLSEPGETPINDQSRAIFNDLCNRHRYFAPLMDRLLAHQNFVDYRSRVIGRRHQDPDQGRPVYEMPHCRHRGMFWRH